MRKGSHHTPESRLKTSRSAKAYWAGVEGRVRALVASQGPMRDLFLLLRDLEAQKPTDEVEQKQASGDKS